MADAAPPREQIFARFLVALPPDGEILLSEPSQLGIATILQTGANDFEERFRQLLRAAPPAEPAAVAGGAAFIVATGPDAWLALREDAPASWALELDDAFAGTAAVVDQSCGYAVLRLEGDAAWRLLAKGAFLDLDPQAFAPGKAAVTVIAHMGVILWRRADPPAFEVAVFRSYAASFWHWLTTAAEGEGLRLGRA